MSVNVREKNETTEGGVGVVVFSQPIYEAVSNNRVTSLLHQQKRSYVEHSLAQTLSVVKLSISHPPTQK